MNKYKSSILVSVLSFIVGFVLVFGGSGCRKTLEPGGAYAPATFATNQTTGVITTNRISQADMAFYTIDAAFRMAYSATKAVFDWEMDNEAFLWGVSPQIKKTLDGIRPQATDAVLRFGIAREAYKANPTPAGLDTMQTLLAKMQQFQATASALASQWNK